MPGIRNAKGHFVPRNSPLAVIGALNAKRVRQTLEQPLAARVTVVRADGTRGSLSADDLAELKS